MGHAEPHYHIRWASGSLDWERHNTHAGAEESARRMAAPGERYTIEHCHESNGTCAEAAAASQRATGTDGHSPH